MQQRLRLLSIVSSSWTNFHVKYSILITSAKHMFKKRENQLDSFGINTRVNNYNRLQIN